MKDKWKVIALVMTAIVLVESCVLIYAFAIGSAMYANEDMCAYEICADQRYDAYTYDDVSGICYCWDGEDIVVEKQL